MHVCLLLCLCTAKVPYEDTSPFKATEAHLTASLTVLRNVYPSASMSVTPTRCLCVCVCVCVCERERNSEREGQREAVPFWLECNGILVTVVGLWWVTLMTMDLSYTAGLCLLFCRTEPSCQGFRTENQSGCRLSGGLY